MSSDSRGATLGAALASAALALGLMAGCTTAGSELDQATVTLNLATNVGAVEGDTAIVSFSVTPDAPASITLPSTAALRLTDVNGVSHSAPLIRALGGFRTETPVIIEDLGRTTMTVLPTGNAGLRQAATQPMVIEDAFGHSLRLNSLTVLFDNEDVGSTTLPSDATLVTPLAGGPLSLGSAVMEGLEPETPVDYSVVFENGSRVEDTGRADSGGSVVFSTFPTSLADDVTSATITFGPERGA
ncbi:MAG: hypothetical protein GF320_02615 [Armatimonadia bacterium]|nr:hypothetical protein [Armatimonadia bacterium]